jgi:hypothetical protein
MMRFNRTTAGWCAAAALTLVLLAGAPAQAKNMHGKFGVGFQRTLLGVQGLTFGYWLTPKMAFQATAGMGFEVYDIYQLTGKVDDAGAPVVKNGLNVMMIGTDSTDTTTILGNMGLKYVIYATKFANLSVGAAVDLGWKSKLAYDVPATQALDEATQALDSDDVGGTITRWQSSVLQWGIEVPIEVEYFFSDALSINLAAGFTFTMVPELRQQVKNKAILQQDGLGAVKESNYTGIGIGVGGLFGQAGFRFYF